MPETTKRLLTVPEFATTLGMTQAGVRRWILERRIATIRVGRLVRIPAAEVDRIIAEGLRPAKPRRAQ